MQNRTKALISFAVVIFIGTMITKLQIFSQEATSVFQQMSSRRRLLMNSQHQDSRDLLHFSMPFSLPLHPSNSFSAHNTYFDTGKRFWRKTSAVCTYDREDLHYFQPSNPSASVSFRSFTRRISQTKNSDGKFRYLILL